MESHLERDVVPRLVLLPTRAAMLTVAALLLGALTACGGDHEPAAVPSASVTTARTGTPSAGPTTVSAPPTAGEARAAAATAAYVVTEGKVVSGPRHVQAERGEQIVVTVLSDKDDELHVHGYDLEVKVKAKATSRIGFVADITGVFEVEMHSGIKLCDLRVG
jgi:hypothetical protein